MYDYQNVGDEGQSKQNDKIQMEAIQGQIQRQARSHDSAGEFITESEAQAFQELSYPQNSQCEMHITISL